MKLRTLYLTLTLLATIVVSFLLHGAARANGTAPPPAPELTGAPMNQATSLKQRISTGSWAGATGGESSAASTATGTGTGGAVTTGNTRALAIGLGANANPSASSAAGCLAVGNKLRQYGMGAYIEGDPIFKTEEVCASFVGANDFERNCQYKTAALVRIDLMEQLRPNLKGKLSVPEGEKDLTAEQCAATKRPPAPPAPPASAPPTPPAPPASAPPAKPERPKNDKPKGDKATGPCGPGKTQSLVCVPVKS